MEDTAAAAAVFRPADHRWNMFCFICSLPVEMSTSSWAIKSADHTSMTSPTKTQNIISWYVRVHQITDVSSLNMYSRKKAGRDQSPSIMDWYGLYSLRPLSTVQRKCYLCRSWHRVTHWLSSPPSLILSRGLTLMLNNLSGNGLCFLLRNEKKTNVKMSDRTLYLCWCFFTG